MYSERKRRDVRLLLAAEVTQERIAALTGVSVSTIRRIAKEPDDPEGKRRRARIGRPSVVAPYRDAVADMLAADPKIKTLAVLRRLRERGYTGGKSSLYDLVRRLRRNVRPI